MRALPSSGICFLRHERLHWGESWKGLSGGGFLDGSIFCRADVRLAHQLISGSSLTACHNPACTKQTIEETGSHFLPALEDANRFLDFPSPRLRGRSARSSMAVSV